MELGVGERLASNTAGSGRGPWYLVKAKALWEPTGEAREAGKKETEPSGATNGTENPASTNRLMEAVWERENLKAAWRQVKANKGSPGVDGMTVVGLKDFLKQHWLTIREQLLNGTYEPKPVM
jgi:RNA-directed DNA polymerase